MAQSVEFAREVLEESIRDYGEDERTGTLGLIPDVSIDRLIEAAKREAHAQCVTLLRERSAELSRKGSFIQASQMRAAADFIESGHRD